MPYPGSEPETVFSAPPPVDDKTRINEMRKKAGLLPLPDELFGVEGLTPSQLKKLSAKNVEDVLKWTRLRKELNQAKSRDHENEILRDLERRLEAVAKAGLPASEEEAPRPTIAMSRDAALADLQRRVDQVRKQIREHAVQKWRRQQGLPEPNPLLEDAQRRADAAANAAR